MIYKRNCMCLKSGILATEYGTGMQTEIWNNGTGIKILKPGIGSGSVTEIRNKLYFQKNTN